MYRFFVKLTFLIPAIVISQGKMSQSDFCMGSEHANSLNEALGKFVDELICPLCIHVIGAYFINSRMS